MLTRIAGYLQHSAFTAICASRYGFPAAIQYGVSPWLKREINITFGNDSFFGIRGRTDDIAVFREVFLRDSYNIEMREPRTILDAGANIGAASVFFARQFPNAQILAIEPEASNFQMLLKNTKDYKNIKAVKGAVWSSKTKLKLINPQKGNVSFRVQSSSTGQAEIQAYSISDLADILGTSHFDLLKIDIEGAEGEVFRIGGDWIQKTTAVFVELHDRYHIGASQTVMRELLKRNFRLETLPASIFIEFI